jgi:phosphonatase-like hydrolase
MAGTTVRDQRDVETCFARAAESTGLQTTSEEIRSIQGWSKRKVFETLWERRLGGREDDWAERVETSYATFKDILETHYGTHEVVPTDGCLDVFAYLKGRGIKIALTTGFYRRVADILLGRLGWLDGLDADHVGGPETLIQISITGDEVPEGRPAPDMIHKACTVLGIAGPGRVINIGDTPSDLQSGKRAGVRYTLGVTNGTHTADQLAEVPNDGLLSSLDALIPFMESRGL